MKCIILTILILASLLAACAPAAATAPAATLPATSPTVTSPARTLTVFAAASLTGSFKEIGQGFEETNPGVTVTLNFAGSQVLRTQIEQGASADVFASADHKNMDALVTGNLVASDYKDFVTNQLVVILPVDNPANLQILENLAKPGLKLVLADISVPAGNYARQILEKLAKDPTYGEGFDQKVLANVVSNETDVKQVVAKVGLGEADAGIVYVTDASAKPDLKTIAIPEQFNIIAKYPIAALAKAPNPDLAAAFIQYVLSADGQAVMKKWGFTPIQP